MKELLTWLLFFTIYTVAADVKDRHRIGPENADCDGAIKVTEPVFGPTNPPEGYGEILEFSGNELGNPHFIEEEHHTVWYYFEMPADGQLTFEIIPEDIEDDYDFMLFEYTGEDFCRVVRTQEIKPVRTNISRNNKAVESRTGLSEKGTKKYVPARPGDDFSKPLEVQQGEIYYLLVDNVYDGGDGHTLKINFPEEESHVNLRVTDKESGEGIDATIHIRKPDDEENRLSLSYTAEQPVQLPLEDKGETYLVNIRAQGYFYETMGVRKGNEDQYLTAELEPVAIGRSASMYYLHFVGNKTELLPQSEPELESLIDFLENHKELEIEVQGHVNGPGRPNVEFYQELSDGRATKVRDFLIEQGVDESRIDYNGYGNTRMLYPSPQNSKEARMNRRVEIVITGIRE